MSAADRSAYIAGMRELMDALEADGSIPLPHEGTSCPVSIYFLMTEDPRAEMAAARRSLGGEWAKDVRDAGEHAPAVINLVRRLGGEGGAWVELTAYRDAVCERVVTGTEERPVEVVVQEAVTETVMQEVETVEWHCHAITDDELQAADAA